MEVNTLDATYQALLQYIYKYGVDKEDRTGTGTKSVFGQQIRHNMSQGFPLLTTKKMAIKTMVTELKWFLKGDTNIKYLVDNGCNIWNGDAYKNYSKLLIPGFHGPWYTQEQFIDLIKTNDAFARDWGELGPIYGAQWREWNAQYETNHILGTKTLRRPGIDQIQNLINDLKTNPDSRRLMVSAWNVGEMDKMVLPPCHHGFQVYTRELNLDERINYYNDKRIPMNRSTDYFHEHMDAEGVPRRAISLMWNQRSVDTPLGLPFNIASYAMILELLAHEVSMVPNQLIGNLGDCHIYQNQIEGVKEQIKREPKRKLPKLKLSNVNLLQGEFDYEIIGYESHPAIKFPLSN